MFTRIALVTLAASLTLTACDASSPLPSASTAAAAGPSAAPTAPAGPAAAPPGTAPAGDLTAKPLQALVAGAASIQITVREAGKAARTVDVKDAKTVSAVVAALGPSRKPTSGMPRCLTPYVLGFLDAAGKPIASVGLCDSPGLAEASRSQGRIDLPGGAMAGFQVADLAALRAALKPLGVELP